MWGGETVSISMWEFVVLRSQGCHNEAPHSGCFQPQIFILSQFWGLGV